MESTQWTPEQVRFFDIAHEGAQLRALAGQVAGLNEYLAGLRPRSVVVLATDQVAAAAARAIAQAYQPQAACPVVVARALPAYVGALDIVLTVGEAADCEWVSRALLTAQQRGAATVFAGPPGPLADDVADDAFLFTALPNVSGPAPARAAGAVWLVLGGDPQALDEAAAAVDAELAACAPDRSADTNPARQLGAFTAQAGGSGVMHSAPAGDRVGEAVASVAAAVWATRGRSGTVVEAAQLPQALDGADTQAADDIFYDPFIDGALTWRVIFWGQEEANLPHSLAVNAAEGSEFSRALQLFTRAYAATAFDE